MPWSGSAPNKSFTRTDGTRTGSQTWQEADAAGVDIVSDDHDTHDQDIADGLSACLLRDGGNTATANIPMGGFRHTNLGDAAALTQALTAKQHINNAGQYCGTVGGTANVITLTTGFSTSAYTAGQTFSFIVGSTNTGSVTVNVDSLGAKSLVRADGSNTALEPGDLGAGALVEIQYDGTRFQLRGPSTTATSADVLARIVKAGSIVAWPHSTVPAGWLECYGQAISRTTYAELYAAIGTTYGVGDGSTTFNLPDMRGRSIFGEDDMGGSSADRITTSGAGFNGDTLGATGGAETVTLARANLPNETVSVTGTTSSASHRHFVAANAVPTTDLANNNQIGYDRVTGGFSGDYLLRGSSSDATIGRTSEATVGPLTVTASGNLNGGVTQTAVNKMPPAIILKWIILALPAAASASALGVHGLQYVWSTSTSGDPGSGKLLVNNGTLSSATALNISETDNVAADVSAFLATWDDSTSTINGFIHVSKVGAPGTFAIFSTSGSLTDNGSYDTFTVAHITSAGTLANGDSVSVLFYRTGDQGEDGPPGGSFPFAFDDGTTDADPGSGNLRFDDADLTAVTEIYISTDTSASSDITDFLDALDDSSSVNRGTIQISKPADPGVFALFTAGVVTSASGYRKIAVSYVDHSGTFTDGDVIAFNFSRSGDKGDTGDDGTDAGILWAFDDSTTTNADPGTGDLRLDNASLASVTEIAISYSTAESGNPSVEDYVKSWDDSTTTTNRGALVIKKKGSAENFAIYTITSAITDGTTYGRFTLSHVVSDGSFTAADVLSVQFFRSGDKGTGDVVGPASAVSGNLPSFSGTTGKLIQDSGVPLIAEFDSVTLAEAFSPASAPSAIRTRGYASAGDGGGALYKNVGSSEPAHDGKIQSADGTWWEIASTPITPAMVGAKRGDATYDSTSDIESAYAIAADLLFDGVYYVGDSGVDLNQAGIARALAPNCGVRAMDGADGGNNGLINLTASGIKVLSLLVDGRDLFRRGVYDTAGGNTVQSCDIKNIYSTTSSSVGIDGVATVGSTYTDNTISEIESVGDGTPSNDSGAARAIRVFTTADVTSPYRIERNDISRVIGEEGDGIQILCFLTSTFYSAGKSIIAENAIRKCSKRGIKVQAHEVTVRNNQVLMLEDLGANLFAGIDVIDSEDAVLDGNRVHTTSTVRGVTVTGTSSGTAKRSTVINNRVHTSSSALDIAISINNFEDATVEGNTVRYGHIAVGNGVRGSVSDNTGLDLLSSGTTSFIQAASTASGLNYDNNVVVSGSIWAAVNVQGPNNTVTNNKRQSGDHRCIYVSGASAVNNIIEGNLSSATTLDAVIYSTATEAGQKLLSGNYNAASAQSLLDWTPGLSLQERTAAPSTPGSGRQIVFCDDAGRQWVKLSSGRLMRLGSGVFGRITRVQAVTGSAAYHILGAASGTADGTATSATYANTNYFTRTARMYNASAASTGANCGQRFSDARTLADAGYVCIVAGWEAFQTNAAAFIGLKANGAHGDADPTSFVNCLGIGINSGQTTWRLIHNDGSGTATATDLGANFPANTSATDLYELTLWWNASPSAINWQVVRLNTGQVTAGTIATDFPGTTVNLLTHIIGNTRSGSTAIQLAWSSVVGEVL